MSSATLTTAQILDTLAAARKIAESANLAAPVRVGGAAMIYYGNPRLTVDVDVLAERQIYVREGMIGVDAQPGGVPCGPLLPFGGQQLVTEAGVQLDWIVRDDEYAPLYAAAFLAARDGRDGYRVVTPEYLVVMKLATGQLRDEDDLRWLLQQPRLVDLDVARGIARTFLGGRFAVDVFNRLVREARHSGAAALVLRGRINTKTQGRYHDEGKLTTLAGRYDR